MIDRSLSPILLKAAAERPVVTLHGPRQSGKTTLVKAVFPQHGYVNLEGGRERELARTDPATFFRRHPPPVIIDEIQNVPELASEIQILVDERRDEPGRFILTGSHQPLLSQTISQSLAGRTALLDLHPPTLAELGAAAETETDNLILRGFMPELWQKPDLDPVEWHRSYFRTYVERDVRQLVNIRNLIAFERFVSLLAGRVGQLVNLEGLSGETGVSSTTLAGWLSVLEASYVVFRLLPHAPKINKRVVRSPKIYFTDVGLAAHLLGLETPEQVARDPLRGNLFENLVVADAWKQRANLGKEPRLSFLRTAGGFEIDLILDSGGRERPMEIKSSRTWHFDFAKGLLRFAAETPNAISPTVIYDGDDLDLSSGVSVRNLRSFRV